MDNLQQLVDQIRSGKYPSEEIDVTQFFHKMSDGEYIPNRDKRIQVRDKDRDIDFIDRITNKIKQSGDSSNLENLTCIYFPDENELKLGNGNHTAEIELNCNISKARSHIVNFNTQLGGKMSNAIRLGNLLNRQEVEKTSVHSNDVKKELFQLIDERESEGLDPRPTEDILDEFAKTYPHVSRRTMANWISGNGIVGGRRKPMRTYTNGELANQRLNFENLEDYKEHVITEPRTLDSWDRTAISSAFVECMKNDKKKALIIFYCSTVAQVETLMKTDIRTKIKNHYAKLSAFWGIQMDTVFLRYE
tara:strand:+ start:68 stop:982 length:915 start_codon:yes stop_codon:yes gene_type:complete